MVSQSIADMLQPWQSAEVLQRVLQSSLEVLLEVLPVNLACHKGRLGHMALLDQ